MLECRDVFRAIGNQDAIGIIALHGLLRGGVDERHAAFQEQDRVGGR